MIIKLRSINPLPLLFGIIIFFLITTRFIFLDILPPGMSNDEVEYTLSSKTYALNGTDLSGVSFPESLFVTKTLGLISPVVPLILSPMHMVISLTQHTARLPYVILSVFTAAILGYLSYLLFKNKAVAYISVILFLLNPWSIFFSRFAVEGAFTLFFFLIGITLFIRLNGWKLIFPFLFFILGFFSYHGAKFTLVPVVLILTAYKIIRKQDFTLKKLLPNSYFLLAIAASLILFTVVNSLFSGSNTADRTKEIIFLNNDLLTGNVNEFRNKSIDSPLNGFFINKVTESIRLFTQNYLSAFSPNTLFLNGDPRIIYAFYYHGLFYLLDILFLIAGFLVLWSRKRPLLLTFFGPLILIAPITTGVSIVGQSVANRSFLLLPLLIMVSSYGIYSIYTYLPKKSYKNIFIILISVGLIISYANFMFLYLVRLPVLAQENYFTSQRVLAKFLNTQDFVKSQKVIVISSEPRQNYVQTIFYSTPDKQNRLLKNTAVEIWAANYQIDNIVFTRNCPTTLSKNIMYILKSEYKCDAFIREKVQYSIVDQKDAGPIYNIYNSSACTGVELTGWNNYHNFSDYAIEAMDKKTFCQRWIAER
jgi:hypothetical protein